MNSNVNLPLCWCALKHPFAVLLPLFLFSSFFSPPLCNQHYLKCRFYWLETSAHLPACFWPLDKGELLHLWSQDAAVQCVCWLAKMLATYELWLYRFFFKLAQICADMERDHPSLLCFWKYSSISLDRAPVFVWPYKLNHLTPFPLVPFYYLLCSLLSPFPFPLLLPCLAFLCPSARPVTWSSSLCACVGSDAETRDIVRISA